MNIMIVIFAVIVLGLVGYFSVSENGKTSHKLISTAFTSLLGLIMSLTMISS